ncbi:hypothetical protein, partial [Streptomyces sp. NPDC059176]
MRTKRDPTGQHHTIRTRHRNRRRQQLMIRRLQTDRHHIPSTTNALQPVTAVLEGIRRQVDDTSVGGEGLLPVHGRTSGIR